MIPYPINKNNAIRILYSLLVVVMVIIIWNITFDRFAGGVVYRKNEGHTISYLLVANKSKKWIFPKGKVKFYELKSQAAIREVVEEAGVNTKLKYKLDGNPFIYRKRSARRQNVDLYAMEYLDEAEVWEERDKRNRKWLLFSDAKLVISPEFTRALYEIHGRLNKY